MVRPGNIDVAKANSWMPASETATPATSSFATSQPALLERQTSHPSPADPKSKEHRIPQQATVRPSVRLLFSQLERRDVILLLLPGIMLSVVCGCLPPLMAKLLGRAFDAFTAYNPMALSNDAIPQQNKDHLMSKILHTVEFLIGLAGLTLFIATVQIALWVCIGERVAKRLRTSVYNAVAAKKMDWFDLGMGIENDDPNAADEHDSSQNEGGLGAGGLMAKFARESDDVRIATSRVSGELIQHLATALASLGLAFYSSWNLTLVILASIPMAILATMIGEVLGNPFLNKERQSTAKASGIVERVLVAINTVKAFNAEGKEHARFASHLERGSAAYRKVALVWAARFGVSSTIALAMFVQGFWYGSSLVQKGRMTAGTVMTVFLSCLLFSNMLQQIVQSLGFIEKGKMGAANMEKLITNTPASWSHNRVYPGKRISTGDTTSDTRYDSFLAGSDTLDSMPPSPFSLDDEKFTRKPSSRTLRSVHQRAVPMAIADIPSSPFNSARSPQGTYMYKMRYKKSATVLPMRKIRPRGCAGEFVLRGVSFAYPSRPEAPVLRNVDMYFPAREMTYVVGGSGSGKSTIAQLLLRLYEPTTGSIELDEQMLSYLDPEWYQEQIASVSQNPIVFDLSLHENIALGLVGSPAWRRAQKGTQGSNVPAVSRADVQAACRIALLHDFIRDLPDGYNTALGQRGASLSGGQKQRLAIARAYIRDPPILILDEATSALDPTARILVHEAIKQWRRGRTTIVITHDLSQVGRDDFVYLLEQGRVAEQGYRSELESRYDGHFRNMLDLSRGNGVNEAQPPAYLPSSPTGLEHQADLAISAANARERRSPQDRRSFQRLSAFPLFSLADSKAELSDLLALTKESKEERPNGLRPLRLTERQAEKAYMEDASRLESAGLTASQRRILQHSGERRRWDEEDLECARHSLDKVRVMDQAEADRQDLLSRDEPTIRRVAAIAWATVPSRVALLLGLACCAAAGTITPFFSYMLSKLLATMAQPDQQAEVLRFSLIVLGLAFVEGFFSFVRFFSMEALADAWVRRLRLDAYRNILRQDRTWFDQPTNSAGNIVTSLVKDAEDARNLIGTIAGQMALVMIMISLAIVWALVVGWQLTLAGLAFLPVFLGCTMLQNRQVARHEGRNKIKREQIGKRFYDMVSNVRGIRAMALESVFERNFADAVLDAQRCGMRAALVTGFGHGLSEALTYLAEALMFGVGAVLITRGVYDFARMVQVFNLIIFAVSFAAQIMSYLPNLSKSMRATTDLNRLLRLPSATSETSGTELPSIAGELAFHQVEFSYELRPDVRILRGASFRIVPGERVAIVGGSGSGKSTVAALTQRLYEPSGGMITLDGVPLNAISTSWLREHIAVVSQHPNLFDMSVTENIAYGANEDVGARVSVEAAATAASVHDTISSLSNGYDTMVGESASLLSGGQAQRIAIARALVRSRARLLVLDECTSALDVDNQQAVMHTLLGQRGVTTLVVTHNVDMMRLCDRILVLQNGTVVQQGHFDALVRETGGVFASLARGGEWSG